MPTLFIQHPVQDFNQWKSVYDSLSTFRSSHGVTKDLVFQQYGGPNDLLIIHEFESMDSLRAYSMLPGLNEAMAKAGISAPPKFNVAD